MLINTYLDTEDFVHLYYAEDEAAPPAQNCGQGARMAAKCPQRPPSPDYSQAQVCSYFNHHSSIFYPKAHAEGLWKSFANREMGSKICIPDPLVW